MRFGNTDFIEKHHPPVAVNTVQEISNDVADRHGMVDRNYQDIRTTRQKLHHIVSGRSRVSVWRLEKVNGVYAEFTISGS
jgi:hypothetical protein